MAHHGLPEAKLCSTGNSASFAGWSTTSCPAQLPPFLPGHSAWPRPRAAPVWIRVAAGASSLGNVPLVSRDRVQGCLHPPIPREGLKSPWVRLARRCLYRDRSTAPPSFAPQVPTLARNYDIYSRLTPSLAELRPTVQSKGSTHLQPMPSSALLGWQSNPGTAG